MQRKVETLHSLFHIKFSIFVSDYQDKAAKRFYGHNYQSLELCSIRNTAKRKPKMSKATNSFGITFPVEHRRKLFSLRNSCVLIFTANSGHVFYFTGS